MKLNKVLLLSVTVLILTSAKAKAEAGLSWLAPLLASGNYAVAQSTPSVPTSISSTADPSIVQRGQTSTVTALVRDQYSNPMAGASVGFSITSGPGSINPASAQTNGAGQASATFTAPAQFPGKSVQSVVRSCIIGGSGACSNVTITTKK